MCENLRYGRVRRVLHDEAKDKGTYRSESTMEDFPPLVQQTILRNTKGATPRLTSIVEDNESVTIDYTYELSSV